MKYGYHFVDWGIYDIVEILEIKELEEDYIKKDAFGKHTFSKDDYVLVKVNNPRYFVTPVWKGSSFDYLYSDEGLFYKKDIFDTKEEAYKYAKEHGVCFW